MKYGAWVSDHLKSVVEQRYVNILSVVVSYDLETLAMYLTVLYKIAEITQFVRYSNNTHTSQNT